MAAWCQRRPGIGLARILSLGRLDEPATRSEIEAALETTLAQGFGDNHCCAMATLATSRRCCRRREARDPWCGAAADRMSAATLDSIRKNGWICGVPSGVETPGLMTGLAGIGFGLLRLGGTTPHAFGPGPRAPATMMIGPGPPTAAKIPGRHSTLGPVAESADAAGGLGPVSPMRLDGRVRDDVPGNELTLREPRHVPQLCLRPTARHVRLRRRGAGHARRPPSPAHRPGADARPHRHRPHRHQPARAPPRGREARASRPRPSRRPYEALAHLPLPAIAHVRTARAWGTSLSSTASARARSSWPTRPAASGRCPRRVLPALDRQPPAGGARAQAPPRHGRATRRSAPGAVSSACSGPTRPSCSKPSSAA